MTYPYKAAYTPADDSANGFAAAVTGVGPWVPTATTSGDGLAHLVALASVANLSGKNITIIGTDPDGVAQVEVVAGPNNGIVYSTKYFMTVTGVSSSATLGASTMDVGWKDVCVTPTLPTNWREPNFQINTGVDISGVINYTVQYMIDSTRLQAPSLSKWWDHDVLAALTADAQSNFAFPITAARVLINSLTAGATLTWTVLQGR